MLLLALLWCRYLHLPARCIIVHFSGTSSPSLTSWRKISLCFPNALSGLSCLRPCCMPLRLLWRLLERFTSRSWLFTMPRPVRCDCERTFDILATTSGSRTRHPSCAALLLFSVFYRQHNSAFFESLFIVVLFFGDEIRPSFYFHGHRNQLFGIHRRPGVAQPVDWSCGCFCLDLFCRWDASACEFGSQSDSSALLLPRFVSSLCVGGILRRRGTT